MATNRPSPHPVTILAILTTCVVVQSSAGQDSFPGPTAGSPAPAESREVAPAAGESFPASTQAATASAPSDNVSPDAIELGPMERIALGAVRDRTRGLDETAFHMLMGHIATLSPLPAEELEALPRPAVPKLLSDPARFRGRAIRLKLHVSAAQKILPGQGISPTPYWPKDRPFWQLSCVNAVAQYPGDEPVVVIATAEPTFLPRPTKTTPDGSKLYVGLGPTIELAGVFYKVCLAKSVGDKDVPSQWRDYPVVLAWQVQTAARAPAKPTGSTAGPRFWSMILIIGGMAIAFFFLKRNVRRQHQPSRQPFQFDEPTDEQKPPARQDGQVDPDLAKALEDYRKEQRGNGKNDPP